jgi:hypothetical protein
MSPTLVERISPQELARLIGKPTLVTLQLKEASALEVFRALSQQAAQAGLKLRIKNEFFLSEHEERITINLVNRPLWEALREVAPKLGLFVQEGYGSFGQMTLDKQGIYLQGPAVSTGPCVIVLDALRGTRTLYPDNRPPQAALDVVFRVLVEPKLRTNPHSFRFHILEARDEKGESLLPSGQQISNHFGGGILTPRLQVEGFRLPTHGAGRMVKLRGTLRFLVQTKSEFWKVPDIMKVRNATRTVVTARGTERYEVIEASQKDDTDAVIKLKVTRQPLPPVGDPDQQNDEAEHFYPFDHNVGGLMRVLDARGKELTHSGGEIGDNGDELTVDLGVTQIAQEPRGKAAVLIWEIPLQYKEVVIPFEFNDLALP